MSAHTPGPWPLKPTGDGKRFIVGEGLVEGPNGYDVAEVYSDDCDQEEAEANARLIAAAPDMLDALLEAEKLFKHTFAENGRAHKKMIAAIAKAARIAA